MQRILSVILIIVLCGVVFMMVRNLANRGDIYPQNGNEIVDGEGALPVDTSGWTLVEGSITKLPPYPGIPVGATFYSKEKKDKIVLDLIDHKLSTYPKTSTRAYRIGKYTGTGLATQVTLREDQLKAIAIAHDQNQLPPMQAEYGRILKKYNPDFRLFMYFDSGIQPEENLDIVGDDAGNVDAENVDWILKNHPDWLLRDAEGNPIISARGTLSNPGSYWGDPGNPEYQEWFAGKINKAMQLSGNIWSGVLLDQFFGSIENFTNYAGTEQQTTYKTDEAFQAAQLSFLKRLSELVKVPVVANLDGAVSLKYPSFFVAVGKVAGGVESEIYPFESSVEGDSSVLRPDSLKLLISAMNEIPPNKHIKINSKPGGLEGNTSRTLYAYYMYLLLVDKNRDIYWTFKEGDSSIPHYWYKEFDLNLGNARGTADIRGMVWTRTFDGAVLVVNPQFSEETYTFTGTKYTLLGQKVSGSIGVPPHTGVLLFPDEATLTKATAHLDK